MTRYIKVSTTGVARKVKPPASAAGASALPGHTHVEADVTDLAHKTNLDSLTDVTIASPTTGQVVKYNGTTWVNDTDATGSGGGGSGGLTLIDHQELTASATAITFSSIPSTYKSLRLVAVLRSDRASGFDEIIGRVGATAVDTGANYGYVRHFVGSVNVNDSNQAATIWAFGPTAGASLATGIFGVAELLLPYYTEPDHHRTVLAHSRLSGASWFVSETSGRWANTADAIGIIELSPDVGTNWIAGSKATLYGMS